MNKGQTLKRFAVVTAGALAIASLSAATSNAAVTPISLGKASNFALVVGGGLTNAGQSSIKGDLALTPVISYSDSGLLKVNGDYHFGDSDAVTAQSDATTAYNAATSETPTVVVPVELAGQTLLPGIYSNPAGFNINGVVNLDAQNNPNALFVVQTPLALTTGAASKINLLNGAQACNVFWQVGTTSSLGAGSDFKGNLLSKGAFVSAAGTVISGRVLISQGSAALNSTQIMVPECKKVATPPTNNLGTGGGSYVSQYGNTSFSFSVKGTDLGNGTFTTIGGKVIWSTNKGWKFSGTPVTYTYVAGVGTIAGTGYLSYYSSPKKGKEGRWLNAATGVVNFTLKYTKVLNSNGTFGKVNTFAIGFSGTPIAGVPTLPTLGSLVKVKGDGDGSDD